MVLIVAKPNLISCNFPSLKTKKSIQLHTTTSLASGCCCRLSSFKPLVAMKTPFVAATTSSFRRSIVICNDSNKQSQVVEGKRDWTTSILLFLLWAALIYYVSFLSPNQTPVIYTFFFHFIMQLAFAFAYV